VRTDFPNFGNSQKCEEDRQALLNENSEIKEIIESCNPNCSIIHVDNPTLNIVAADEKDSEDEVKLNEGKRKESRENC
jgi:hypothetical protein